MILHASDAEQPQPARIADADLALIAHRSWQAAEVRDLDGWLIAQDRCTTRRTNSVLPLGEPPQLAMAIGLVEALYRRHGRPAAFVIAPWTLPGGLDETLAELGYEVGGSCLMMVAQTAEVVAAAGERTRPVHVAGGPDQAYAELWSRVDGRPADALAEVSVRTPSVHASLRREGRVWAIGRGTLDSGWCGLTGLVTDPQARGHGLGTDIIAEIASRALRAGARGMWLQVRSDNPARALYERLGFTTQYAYHYRVRDLT